MDASITAGLWLLDVISLFDFSRFVEQLVTAEQRSQFVHATQNRPASAYIQDKAADHDGRIVTIGQLILFSTDTGDAWLLDITDQLAARLAKDGDPEPIYLEETDTSFAIEWKGHYRIEGPAFVYADRDTGRVTTIPATPHRRSRARADFKISNIFG